MNSVLAHRPDASSSNVAATRYSGPERRRMPRSAMADVLHAIAAVELLAPENLPSLAAMREALTPALRKTCLAALAKPTQRPSRALAALARALPGQSPKPWQDIRFLIDTDQTADDDTHDHFFRIRRSAHSEPLGFLRGLFFALDRLIVDVAETPTSLPRSAIAEIGAGLTAAIAAALDAPAPATVFAPVVAEAPARPDAAKWRWIRGHQIFAPLTQGLIFAFNALEAARDVPDYETAAELCRALMLASARALEFTGDFPVEIYRDSIRASMEAPFQPKGFSGILSADHRRFVSRMRGLRPAIEQLKAMAPQAHAGVVAALTQVYDSHKFVCGRFVGTDQASLLMASECSRSAVEQIDRFKQMRLRTLQ